MELIMKKVFDSKAKLKAKLNWKKDLRLAPGYAILILWVLFTFYLISWIMLASFSSTREILTGRLFQFAVFNFDNYVRVWGMHRLSTFFNNSLIYTISSCILIIIVAAPAAYALSKFKFKFNRLIQNMFMTALGIPGIMIVMPLFAMALALDLDNSRLTLILIYVCVHIPFNTFFLMAFYSNLPSSYEEAAYIDGCGPIKAFWKVMFPLSQPGIITVSIFNFIGIWNEFLLALIFANDLALRPVGVGLYGILQGLRTTGDWGSVFAATVIVFVPTLILFIAFSEKIIANITGGLKG